MRATTEQTQDVLQKIQNQKAALETEFANISSEHSTALRHLNVLKQTERVIFLFSFIFFFKKKSSPSIRFFFIFIFFIFIFFLGTQRYP